MRPSEMDALIEQGAAALQAALASGSLSAHERQIVERAIARSVEAPAEEPADSSADSEPEPKAQKDKTSGRSILRRSAKKKG